jgi:hypothetical protein
MSAPVFDYKKLLVAYLWHVGEMEGCTFLGRSADSGIDGLNAAEVEELRTLDKLPFSFLLEHTNEQILKDTP